MRDLDSAKRLLLLARKDLRAVATLTREESPDVETVGFHAQQAVEKTMKAWLAMLGVEFPRTHSLRILLSLLEEHNVEVDEL